MEPVQANTVLAEKCPGCNGLGIIPDWGIIMPECGLCLGSKQLTLGRVFELLHAEEFYRNKASEQEKHARSEDLKKQFGYERPAS